MDLKNATKEELLAELAKREKPPVPRPVKVAYPDYLEVTKMVERAVAEIIEGRGYFREDFAGDVYEAVIRAIYGETFWRWKTHVQNGGDP